MQWAQPSFRNRRFGFEITMFIYMKPSPVMTHPKQHEYIYSTMLQHACHIPDYTEAKR